MPKNYIAYGSNLNMAQMKYRCPDASLIGVSTLKNYRLLFKGSKTGSYLTIEPAAGYEVPVAIFSISDRDERNLDRYEGFPTFYYKKDITVTDHNGVSMDAFAYIMHEDHKLGIPTHRYVATCLQGYEYFGFNDNFIYEAYINSEEAAS